MQVDITVTSPLNLLSEVKEALISVCCLHYTTTLILQRKTVSTAQGVSTVFSFSLSRSCEVSRGRKNGKPVVMLV